MNKQCKCCYQYKILSEFHKDASKPDGTRIYCKSCQLSKLQSYRESNRAKNQDRDPYNKYERLFKRCTHCKEELTVFQFRKNPNFPDGLACECDECHKEYLKQYRAKAKSKCA